MQRKLLKLHGLCCNKLSINNKNLKNFSENVPTGYGLSHSKCLQKIIDVKLKKKNTHILQLMKIFYVFHLKK